jgi:hypothetical protein
VAGVAPGRRGFACRVPKGASIVVEAKVAKQGTRSSRQIMHRWSVWFSCMEYRLKGEAEAYREIQTIFRESEIGAKDGRTLQREAAADPVALAHAFLEEF